MVFAFQGMAAQAVLSAALANGAATKYSSALGHGAVAQAVYVSFVASLC